MPEDATTDALDARPLALFVGEPNARAREVLAALVPSSSSPSPPDASDDADDADGSDASDRTTTTRWTLDTKYYVADIAASVCVIESASSSSSSASRDSEPGVVIEDAVPSPRMPSRGPEAIVLVFDPSRPNALARLTSWAAASSSSSDAATGYDADDDATPTMFPETEIKLVVCAYATTAAARANAFEEVRAAERWAGAHGFEAVAVALDDVDVDVDGRAGGLDVDGDAHGFKRVKDALEAHHWPGSVFKPRGGGAAAGAAVPVEDAKPAPADDLEDDLDDDLEDNGGDLEDDLEQMMAEVARVRAAGVGVGDEERRRMAADAAARMMEMFGGAFGSDDDDDDDDGKENGAGN